MARCCSRCTVVGCVLLQLLLLGLPSLIQAPSHGRVTQPSYGHHSLFSENVEAHIIVGVFAGILLMFLIGACCVWHCLGCAISGEDDIGDWC